MRLHVQEAQFENGEQSAGARANNQHIGFDRVAHIASFRLERPMQWERKMGEACLANTGPSGKA
jgi:hypothetical protein